MRNANEKIVLIVLLLLALSNLIFLIFSPYSGPIVGFIVAAAAAIHWWRKKDALFVIIISIVWIFFHIYELFVMGISSRTVLFSLNVLLPVILLYLGIKEKRHKSIGSG